MLMHSLTQIHLLKIIKNVSQIFPNNSSVA